MILVGAIFGIAAAILSALAIFWQDIINWLKKAINRLQEVLGVTIKGSKTFIKRTADGFQNVSKHYNINKITGEWEENIFTKVVSESDIPQDILMKVQNSSLDQEVSTTEELELELNRVN